MGGEAETCSDRILVDVFERGIEVRLIADVAVEVVILPKSSALAEDTIDSFGGKRLPGVDDVRDAVATIWGQEHVDVIGHYHPGVKTIAFLVEVKERPFDYLREARIRE